jgi:hypothetical protein
LEVGENRGLDLTGGKIYYTLGRNKLREIEFVIAWIKEIDRSQLGFV